MLLKALSSSNVRKRLGESPPSQSAITSRQERFNVDSDRIENRNTRSGKTQCCQVKKIKIAKTGFKFSQI